MTNPNRFTGDVVAHDYDRVPEGGYRDRPIEPGVARESAEEPVAGEGSLEAQRRKVIDTVAKLAGEVAELQGLLKIVMDPTQDDAALIAAIQHQLEQLVVDVTAFADAINNH